MAKLNTDVLTEVELKSMQEWLEHWGPGPNWSDTTGASIPITKDQLQRLINTAEHWKKRAAQHGCNVEGGDHECG